MKWSYFIFVIVEVLGSAAYFISAAESKDPIKKRVNIIWGLVCVLALLITFGNIYQGVSF